MGNQPSPIMLVSILMAIFFSSTSCFSQSTGGLLLERAQQQQQHASSLIQKACNHSVYKDFCIASLESDPRTISADPKELTVIAIDIAKTNGTAILAYITNELIGNSTGNVSHSISLCQQEYQYAIRSTNQLTGSAAGDVDLCKSDGSIVVQEVPPLLILMSEIMFKLCDNALEVLCYSSKECKRKRNS